MRNDVLDFLLIHFKWSDRIRVLRHHFTSVIALGLMAVSLPTTMSAEFVYCSAAEDQEIAVFQLDPTDGTLKPVERLAVPGQPGALTQSPDGQFLFAAMRSTAQIAGFRISKDTGKLKLINIVDGGADPAQISTDRSGRYLMTAYYIAAQVTVHHIAMDGTLSVEPVSKISTDAKAHAIMVDSSNQFVFVPHTGPNAIYQFRLNPKSGTLEPARQPVLQRPASTGPRHLAWHPKVPVAYIDNEQGSSVTAYRMSDDGILLPGQTETTLLEEFQSPNSTAEIKIHPGGRFLYVSNRGNDSIAVIAVDKTGERLRFVTAEPTEKTPRSFDLDSTGRYLLVAGESSGQLAVNRVTQETGKLELLHKVNIGPMFWWVEVVGAANGEE
jgi:6-phosphogluconolactonase